MSKEIHVRWGWLKGMYIYTIVVAGGFGLGVIFIPSLLRSVFKLPTQDPIVLGIVGSIYLASGLLALLGLRAPLKFSPLLLLQLCYKAIWFIGVVLPILVSGKFQPHAISFIVVFATFIIGDLIAIPFSYLFARHTKQE